MEQNDEAGIDPPPAWSPVPPSRIAAQAALREAPAWLGGVEAIVGSGFVLSSLPDRWVYSRDRSPYAVFQVRNSAVPATLPAAIACPGTVQELAGLLRYARTHSIPVVPFGAGSGVLGGTLPVAGELVIDLKRLNRILDLDEIDGTITVQAGMNGAQFEEHLNTRGFTSGHFPQSLHMSTVGGWAACRSAGQNSTRYGKFEDMVLGLEVVLPDGKLLRVRPMARHGAGPSLASLFVGSEGAYGVISELTLRVWRQPEARRGLALAFPSVEAGLEALRATLQSELRPAVVRLYDLTESLQRTSGKPPFDSRPILAILEHCGLEPLAELESRLTCQICAGFDAVQAGPALYEEWQVNRFGSLSTPWQVQDYYVDTIEVVAGWSALPGLYAATRDAVLAVSPEFHFGTHWSHVYPEGACQYMTLRLPPMPQQRALDLLRTAWGRVQCLCLAAGGSIAHHHGIGLFRGPWLRQELGTAAFGLLQDLKDCLDPQSLLVPGKLGLAAGARARRGDLP